MKVYLRKDGTMGKYAIIGFGCAGYNAAKAIRECNDNSSIDVYEQTKEPPANPMLTTYYASDRLTLKGSYPFGNLEEIKDELKLTMKSNVTVQTVDLKTKTVITTDGTKESYDKILLATGASALLPPMEGLPSDKVFVMRTMDDAHKLRNYLDAHPVKQAMVVGASMVGIKVVELLYNRKIDTTLVDLAPFLFPLAAYENVGRELERRLQEKGIHCLWEKSVSGITKEGVSFLDGSESPADLICFCIGTRANLDLVGNTDLVKNQSLEIKKGIVVNQKMETNIPDIYAAGDCCEGTNIQTGESMIIGLWANAGYQGETAGKNMAGYPSSYSGTIVHNITHYLDTDFIGLGDTRITGETISFGDIISNLYIQAVRKNGKIQSMNILGNEQISGVLKSYFTKQLTQESNLSTIQKGVLLKNGISIEFIEQLEGVRI